MKKSILNAAALTLGSDGRVQIADEELLEIERDLVVTAAGGLMISCTPNQGCGGQGTPTWFNSRCSNTDCAGGEGSLNDNCENFNCDFPESSNGVCAKLVKKPF